MSRGFIAAATVLLAVCVGCRNEECLRPDAGDVSPPDISLTIIFRPPSSVRDDTLIVTASDPSRQIDADNAARFRVGFRARDPQGVRRLQLGASVLTTVGIGIESKRAPVEPVMAQCPVAELSGAWRAPPGDPGRSISLGLVGENWAGLLASTQTVTVRLR